MLKSNDVITQETIAQTREESKVQFVKNICMESRIEREK